MDLSDLQTPWFTGLWAMVAYLLASLSPGDLVARWGGVDIRARGAGNPGTANIYKEMGPGYGIAVLVLDLLIGAAATVPLYLLDFPGWGRLLAVAWVLTGHIFPVFWKFNGGVGGAVAMGAAFGLLPFGALTAAAVVGLALALTGLPSTRCGCSLG